MVKKVEHNDKDSLSEALLVLGYNTSVQLAETMTFGYDNLSQLIEAYTWKHNSVLRDCYSFHGDCGLRRCGYALWDSVRLRLCGMTDLEYDPSVQSRH